MPAHRLHTDAALPAAGSILRLEDDEARHALVKRLEAGEEVEVLNGRGTIATGRIAAVTPGKGKRPGSVEITIGVVRSVEAERPALHVLGATPKGDRVDSMIEQLSQIGAASWRPLRCARSVVDPREGKIDRLRRIAIESSKQCGRAHTLGVLESVTLAQVLAEDAATRAASALVVADVVGSPYRPTGAPSIRLLIGPEGDWTPEELSQLRASGAQLAGFGPHAMRVETAAAVCAAIVMCKERERNA